MPRLCTVCKHPERVAVEAALVTESLRNVAERHALSVTALHRHRTRCIAAAVGRARNAREDFSVEQLLDKLTGYVADLEHGIEIAKSAKDLTGLARLSKEARETVVYLGKTLGMWANSGAGHVDARSVTVNVLNVFAKLPPVVLEALEDPSRARVILMALESPATIAALTSTLTKLQPAGARS